MTTVCCANFWGVVKKSYLRQPSCYFPEPMVVENEHFLALMTTVCCANFWRVVKKSYLRQPSCYFSMLRKGQQAKVCHRSPDDSLLPCVSADELDPVAYDEEEGMLRSTNR